MRLTERNRKLRAECWGRSSWGGSRGGSGVLERWEGSRGRKSPRDKGGGDLKEKQENEDWE